MTRSSCGFRSMAAATCARDLRVADAVKAITTNAETRSYVFRQRVLARAPRQRGVKRRVEHRHVRHAREQFARAAHRLQGGRIVQRRQPVERAQRRQRFIVDDDGRGEALAAVHDAMDDGIELAEFRPAFAQLPRTRHRAPPE